MGGIYIYAIKSNGIILQDAADPVPVRINIKYSFYSVQICSLITEIFLF